MESSRRDPLNDMVELKSISKNYQNTYYPSIFKPLTSKRPTPRKKKQKKNMGLAYLLLITAPQGSSIKLGEMLG